MHTLAYPYVIKNTYTMHIASSFQGGSGYENVCLSYSSALPEIFGPGIWWTLHTTASTYPSNPSPDKQKACIAFVSSLPSMLPCQSCNDHLTNELQNIDLPHACQSGENLSRMWCAVHNAVNQRTNKPLMDCEGVYKEYQTVPVCRGRNM